MKNTTLSLAFIMDWRVVLPNYPELFYSALNEYSNHRSDDERDRRFQKRKNGSGLRRKRIKIKKLVPKQAR